MPFTLLSKIKLLNLIMFENNISNIYAFIFSIIKNFNQLITNKIENVSEFIESQDFFYIMGWDKKRLYKYSMVYLIKI